MIWGDILLFFIFSCIIISSFWNSYANTIGCFLQPQCYIPTLCYGVFALLFIYLFLSSNLYVLSVSICLVGVSWSPLVQCCYVILFSVRKLPAAVSSLSHFPFPSFPPSFPEVGGPQRGRKLWTMPWVASWGFRLDIARCPHSYLRKINLQLEGFQTLLPFHY